MAALHPHWYNLNEQRCYPLDESASGVDDQGQRLPLNIITDLRLRYPSFLGAYAFVGAVTVTAYAVSVTIQAADSLEAEQFTPLAAITVALDDFVEGRQYRLASQYPGVGGWIVLGSGTGTAYAGRFSTPAQSLLVPRAVRAGRTLPITAMAKLHARQALTGVIQLRGEAPIEVAKEAREIDGVSRDVIVIRLVEPADTSGTTSVSSIFEEFAGPCAGRPESKSCSDPQPIEFVNSVAPDCEGVLTLQLQGCAIAARNVVDCSLVIDCGLGLSDACLPPALPNNEGLLPSEYIPVPVEPPIEPEPPDTYESISEDFIVVGELPYLDCFYDGDAANFRVPSGEFTFVEDFDPFMFGCAVSNSESESNATCYATEGVNSAGTRNVAVFDGFDVTTLERMVSTDLLLPSNENPYIKHNGGIVINYREHSSIPDRYVYYIAEIDYDTQELRIRRFNGTTFVNAVAANVGLALDTWYRLSVSVHLSSNLIAVELTATLQNAETEEVLAQLGPLNVNNYAPTNGLFGFGSNRAYARFNHFYLDVLS